MIRAVRLTAGHLKRNSLFMFLVVVFCMAVLQSTSQQCKLTSMPSCGKFEEWWVEIRIHSDLVYQQLPLLKSCLHIGRHICCLSTCRSGLPAPVVDATEANILSGWLCYSCIYNFKAQSVLSCFFSISLPSHCTWHYQIRSGSVASSLSRQRDHARQ